MALHARSSKVSLIFAEIESAYTTIYLDHQ